ncbi:FadR/GntR family transcriptional regulator [Microterricola viridarii]|uniref:FadR/GntR family transcriptional regulator n=1 Tax=Microterricola viridarii TaxID=412690 RepID=UPI001365CC8A|nr:FCD domain-containing protein [Microterricola viridarii]
MGEPVNPPVEIDPAGLRDRPGYHDVVDFLRREIALGRLRPGDRLPAERKLAAQLGVARETLRQALKVLEAGGQLRILRGAAGGPVVQQAEPDAASLRTELVARGGDIIGFTEFRGVVEGAAARMAAERRSDAVVERLEAAQEELAAAVTKAESRLADSAFHLTIAEAAGNPMLAHAIDDARVRVFDSVDLMPFEFIKESSYLAHQRILEAIRARDPEAASEAMRAHIATTKLEFERIIDAPGTAG